MALTPVFSSGYGALPTTEEIVNRARQSVGAGLTPPVAAQPAAPRGVSGPLYDPVNRKFFVNGQIVDERDETGLLQATRSAEAGAAFAPPEGGNWVPVDQNYFAQRVGKIADPDFLTRAGKSFESAVAGSGELLGATTRFVGLEEPGRALMEMSQRRQQELSTYNVGLEDIGTDPTIDVFDWTASVIGQLGPGAIESLASIAIGAVAGGAAGGGNPLSATAGAVVGFIGKEGFKKAAREAAEAYFANRMKSGFTKKMAYDALSDAQKKTLRTASIVAGGSIGGLSQGYLQGLGDIYSQQLESGTENRLLAALFAAPYAAANFAPEALLGAKIFGTAIKGKPRLNVVADKTARAKDLLARVGAGTAAAGKNAAILGSAEGASEAFQEYLVMAADAATDWDSPETASRLVNSFAAGALGGALLGAPVNLLNRGASEVSDAVGRTKTVTTANVAPPTVAQEAGAQGELFPGAAEQRAPAPVDIAALGQRVAEVPSVTGIQQPTPTEVQGLFNERGRLQRGIEEQYNELLTNSGQANAAQANPIIEQMRAAQGRINANPLMQGATAVNPANYDPNQLNLFGAPAEAVSQTQERLLRTRGQAMPATPVQDIISLYAPQIDSLPYEQQTALYDQLDGMDPLQARVLLETLFKGRAPMARPSAEQLKVKTPRGRKATAPAETPAIRTTTPAPTTVVPNAAVNSFDSVPTIGVKPETKLGKKPTAAGPLKAKPTKTASVQLMITQAMRKQLYALGYGDNSIREMKPQEAADIIANKIEPKPRSPIAQFRENFAQSGSAAMRQNPDLTRLADLVDYLGSLTDAQWKKLEGKFTRADNPYLIGMNPGFDIDATRAKIDSIINPQTPPKGGKTTNKVTKEAASAKSRGPSAGRTSGKATKAEAPAAAPAGKPATGATGTGAGTKPTVAPTPPKQANILGDDDRKIFSSYMKTADNPKSIAGDITDALEGIYWYATQPATDVDPDLAQAARNYLMDTDVSDLNAAQQNLVKQYRINLRRAEGAAKAQPEVTKAAKEAETTAEQINKEIIEASDGPNTGRTFRDDGTVLEPMSFGEVKLLATNIVSKFRVKPKLYVYASREDLKAKNPKLYREAAAAREEGDFDTVPAIAYSFGDNVIVFADRIRTEKQLALVLAHETIGHYGLRAIASDGDLRSVLDYVYENDLGVAREANILTEGKGMSKYEAIEEVLAVYASVLDTSLLHRIGNFIIRALSKIGIKVPGEATAFLLSQARAYIRNGHAGVPFSHQRMIQTIHRINEAYSGGRFLEDRISIGNASRAFSRFTSLQSVGATAGEIAAVTPAALASGFRTATEFFRTTNSMAQFSRGMAEGNQLLHDLKDAFSFYMNKYKLLTTTSDALNQKDPELAAANDMIAKATLFRTGTEGEVERLAREFEDKLYTIKGDGTVEANPDVVKRLSNMSVVSPEEFQKGFTIRDQKVIDEEGNEVIERGEFFKDEKATKDSTRYKVYLEQHNLRVQLAVDRLISVIVGSQRSEDISRRQLMRLAKLDGSKIATDDMVTLREISAMYRSLLLDNASFVHGKLQIPEKDSEFAQSFLNEVTAVLFEKDGAEALGKWLDAKADDELRSDPRFDKIRDRLKAFAEGGMKPKDVEKIRRTIADSATAAVKEADAEMYAKTTIIGHYTPFEREGSHFVEVIARDKTGKRVPITAAMRNDLPYYEVGGAAQADLLSRKLKGVLAEDFQEITLEDGSKVEVMLDVISGRARRTSDVRSNTSAHEVLRVLKNIGYNAPQTVRERLIELMTDQDSASRRNLTRRGRPGYDPDMRRHMANFAEFVARVSSNNMFRPLLDDLMSPNSSWKWLGSAEELTRLEARVKAATNAEAKFLAERDLAEYKVQYRYSAPTGSSVMVNGVRKETLGRGQKYFETFKGMLDYLETVGGEVIDTPEKILSSELGSRARAVTVTLQLGGSVASAALNFIGMMTNTTPYLATYNQKNGFGLGHGFAKVHKEMFRSIANFKNGGLADVAFLEKIAEKKNWGDFGMDEREFRALQIMTEQGVLQAAQFNALSGTARGRTSNGFWQKVGDGWMFMFNYAEQINRRVTAMTAYRLEYDRFKKSGLSDAEANKKALKAAEDAVNTTQGSYGVLDRPEFARGNILQYVYMYKQFLVISMELLSAMDWKGKLYYLAILFFFAGLKGFPGSEDLTDLIDTLMKFAGVPSASVEAEVSKLFDSVIPGSGRFILRGGADDLLGGISIGSRVGQGNFFPGTGIFLAGADIPRELSEVAGPVFSAAVGVGSLFGGMASFTAESLGLKTASYTTFRDLLRESPISAARALGDTWAYMDSGAIVSTSGKIISEGADAGTYISRLLGFYPAVAVRQNDVVRIAKQIDARQKEIAADFRLDYVKAHTSRNAEEKRKILARIAAWNKAAKGTGLEVKNFLEGANRAIKAAEKPTATRYLDSVSKSVRPIMRDLMEIYGVEPSDLK